MKFESLILPVLFIFFLLSSFFVINKKWMSLLGLLFISFGLGAFNILYGTLWFPYKVVMIPMIIYTLFNIKFTAVRIINSYFIILVISVLVAILTAPDEPGKTFLQGPAMRPLVQLYTYAGLGLMIPFIIFIVNSPDRLQKSLKLYFRLSEIIIIFGVIHLIYIILGLEFIPIIRSGGADSVEAAFRIEEVRINRIYGFSGEPKTLATFVLPYLFISIYNYIENNFNINRIFHLTLLIASLLVIIYTFSTAILISSIFCVAIIPYLFRNRIKSSIVRFAAVVAIGGLILIEVNNLFVKQEQKDETEQLGWLDIVYDRSFGRVDDEFDERRENIALNYIFKENPIFLPTGFGLGMYNYHLPLPMHSRGVAPIDSGWVVILMDLGIIGLLFFFTLFRFILRIKRDNRLLFDNNIILNSYLIGAFVGFVSHLGNNSLYWVFLFFGLSLAAAKVLSESEQQDNSLIYKKI